MITKYNLLYTVTRKATNLDYFFSPTLLKVSTLSTYRSSENFSYSYIKDPSASTSNYIGCIVCFCFWTIRFKVAHRTGYMYNEPPL